MERKKLIEFRTRKNVTQKEVATAVNITTSYYGMIELGVRTPTMAIAGKIAEYFSASIEEIFFDNSDNNMLYKTI